MKKLVLITILYLFTLFDNSTNGQQSFFGGISELFVTKTPKINTGITLGMNLGLGGKSEKFQLSLSFKYYFSKKYDFNSTAFAFDSVNTQPYILDVNSSLKIGYTVFGFGGIYYVIGTESGKFNIYSKFGIDLIIANYRSKTGEYDSNKYDIPNQLDPDWRYNNFRPALFLGFGLEKRMDQFLIFCEMNYFKIINFDIDPIDTEYFQPYGNYNALNINIGIRILRL